MSYHWQVPEVLSAPDSSAATPTGRVSSRRLASNRRNALKSTGPRTKAGKYRSALNARKRDWCPETLERELRACGEDPREFCCLHRDLAAIFRPTDEVASTAVELLARTWWQKARRLRRGWVPGFQSVPRSTPALTRCWGWGWGSCATATSLRRRAWRRWWAR